MNNIMIDIETLDLAASCVILQIGAVRFDISGLGETFRVNVDIDSCLDCGMTISSSTLRWWLNRPREAVSKAFLEPTISIADALIGLSSFIREDALFVWANGIAFDISALSDAYGRVLKSQPPWKYWMVRDYRTLRELFPQVPPPSFDAAQHDALCDAIWQARHASAILEFVS